MNREIKFRGKPLQGGYPWGYGNAVLQVNGKAYLFENEDKNAEVIPEFDEGFRYTVDGLLEVAPDTIGQYTGLKDKVGKKIFEGDILRLTIPDGSTRHFVVEWANRNRLLMPLGGFEHDGNAVRISGWCFNWEGRRLYPSFRSGVPDNERMTIVGNIHDNPEMVKGGEK